MAESPRSWPWFQYKATPGHITNTRPWPYKLQPTRFFKTPNDLVSNAVVKLRFEGKVGNHLKRAIFSDKGALFFWQKGTVFEQNGIIFNQKGTFSKQRDTFIYQKGTFSIQKAVLSSKMTLFLVKRNSFSAKGHFFSQKET